MNEGRHGGGGRTDDKIGVAWQSYIPVVSESTLFTGAHTHRHTHTHTRTSTRTHSCTHTHTHTHTYIQLGLFFSLRLSFIPLTDRHHVNTDILSISLSHTHTHTHIYRHTDLVFAYTFVILLPRCKAPLISISAQTRTSLK